MRCEGLRAQRSSHPREHPKGRPGCANDDVLFVDACGIIIVIIIAPCGHPLMEESDISAGDESVTGDPCRVR